MRIRGLLRRIARIEDSLPPAEPTLPDEELVALAFEAIKRLVQDERSGVRPPGSARAELLGGGFSEDAVEVLVRAAEEALDRQPT